MKIFLIFFLLSFNIRTDLYLFFSRNEGGPVREKRGKSSTAAREASQMKRIVSFFQKIF